MYVRFHSPWAEVRRGVHYGLFGPAYDCARDPGVPEVLRAALWHEIEWFEANLPVPAARAFWVKSRKTWHRVGICWFVDDAREMIARAFALRALLRDCGVPVTKIATDRPGQVLYRDAWQIVAKPEAATPTVWH
jgi:hypothetical protein